LLTTYIRKCSLRYMPDDKNKNRKKKSRKLKAKPRPAKRSKLAKRGKRAKANKSVKTRVKASKPEVAKPVKRHVESAGTGQPAAPVTSTRTSIGSWAKTKTKVLLSISSGTLSSLDAVVKLRNLTRSELLEEVIIGWLRGTGDNPVGTFDVA
jgi:hypothetical protein